MSIEVIQEERNRVAEAKISRVVADTGSRHLGINLDPGDVVALTIYSHTINLSIHNLTVEDFKSIQVACEEGIKAIEEDLAEVIPNPV